MEAVSTCSAEGQSKLLLVLLKMRCVWFGFEMTPSTDRTPYCTTVDCTILYSRPYWPMQTVQYNTCIWFKPEGQVLCCCNLSFFAKDRDSATKAMVPLSMMVHSQLAVLLPVGEARVMHLCILKTDG